MPVQTAFAEVILPLAVEGTFTYSIPESLEGLLRPGIRVLVPLGKKKIYTGVVAGLSEQAPENLKPKKIFEALDTAPMVTDFQLQLWKWMASYYMCSPGEVLRAALPSGMRPGSESKVRISRTYLDNGVLDQFERLLFEVIRDQGEISLSNLEISGIGKKPLKILQQLVDKGAVEIDEFVQRSSPKQRITYYKLVEESAGAGDLHLILDRLEKAPRQKEVFERFLRMTGVGQTKERIKRDKLVERETDASALSALVRKGILAREEREESGRDTGEKTKKNEPSKLNPEQAGALDSIRSQFADHQAVLLQGVTSSGKTELYIHLIREQLESGKQVLYLLPEIALTEHIIMRLRHVFGTRVGVYHSRYSDAGRTHVYRNLLGLTDEKPYSLVVGVRSAVFLPIQDLGLVIIDEEHEHSFKQHDPAPRYHARDTAQILALFHGAKVLLGTATPSFESLYNARSGKYGYAQITGRYGEVESPEIIIADTREAMKKKQMVSHFTPELIRHMEDALGLGEQVILFRNRRGYSHYIVCVDCNQIPKCGRCDVSLTYHSVSRKLECHYCGHKENIPSECRSCGSANLRMMGFGTEKLEEELPLVFPGVRVGRLDTDTARSRIRTEKLLRDFAERRLDVLVGTQMISKGLDFEGVSLVGVLDADSMLHFPDFRAFERTFQLVYQVSGRAGRRSRRGKVVLQTMDPSHPVIGLIREGDYEALYLEQMEERRIFGYPPYTRMIRISFRHRVPPILDGATKAVADHLREAFGNRVLGPQYPPVRKVKNLFIKQVILKIEKEASYDRAKSIIGEVLKKVMHTDVYRPVHMAVDVDPY